MSRNRSDADVHVQTNVLFLCIENPPSFSYHGKMSMPRALLTLNVNNYGADLLPYNLIKQRKDKQTGKQTRRSPERQSASQKGIQGVTERTPTCRRREIGSIRDKMGSNFFLIKDFYFPCGI